MRLASGVDSIEYQDICGTSIDSIYACDDEMSTLDSDDSAPHARKQTQRTSGVNPCERAPANATPQRLLHRVTS